MNDNLKFDIIIFWKQYDAGVYGRRVDMLAKYLSIHNKVQRVVFIDPPLWLNDLNALHDNTDNYTERKIVLEEIYARRLGLRDKKRLSFHTFVYDTRTNPDKNEKWKFPKKDQYLSYIENIFRDLSVSMENSIFLVYPPNVFLREIISYFEPRCVITDIVDDVRENPYVTKEKKAEYSNNYKEVISNSDFVITNTTHLQKSMGDYSSDIRFLPNAMEFLDHDDNDHKRYNLKRLLAISSPKIGYVGNLESKVDIELLKFIAIERPSWNIILIGSSHTRPEIVKLNKYPNIHLVGPLKYDEARAWMKQFDAAIIPHLDTPLTRSMNPLKAYVYIGMGLPVVSTNIKNIENINGMLHIAENYDDFLKKIELVLSSPKPDLDNQLLGLLQKHTWTSRIDQVMNWIEHTKFK